MFVCVGDWCEQPDVCGCTFEGCSLLVFLSQVKGFLRLCVCVCVCARVGAYTRLHLLHSSCMSTLDAALNAQPQLFRCLQHPPTHTHTLQLFSVGHGRASAEITQPPVIQRF